MKRVECGITGRNVLFDHLTWTQLEIPEPWEAVARILNPNTTPRAVQIQALRDQRVLQSRRNLIVSAPTNSGKSLIATMLILDAVRRGRRAILIEPLRALAREKYDELQAVAPELSIALNCPITVRISTGDYRLEHETLADPPPNGEILIATPERLDAILRNPDYDAWIDSVQTVCIDEAQLLRSSRRGVTLEYVITSLLCRPTPPRLALLSATLGTTDRLEAWLQPCDTVSVAERYPPLETTIFELDENDDVDDVINGFVAEALRDPSANVLIFVYQTRSAELLARNLGERLGDHIGAEGAMAYHSQMSSVRRRRVHEAMAQGRTRCVVATTALAMGVNLPATHVIVRDTTFPGAGALGIDDLLQMTGRSGRGDQTGHAIILLKPHDAWKACDLSPAVRNSTVPEITSPIAAAVSRAGRSVVAADVGEEMAGIVARLLVREPENGLSEAGLKQFLERSLCGRDVAAQAQMGLTWLMDPSRMLAFLDDQGHYRLTRLGLAATRSMLPLSIAAGIGQLIRDLLTLDPTDALLERWSPLDQLVILELYAERAPRLRAFSASLAEQVDGWMDSHPDQSSMLYANWLRGEQGYSRAIEVLGSLGVTSGLTKDRDEAARRIAYLAVFRSIVLYERGQGVSAADLERRWRVARIEEVEERWRDERLWLLHSGGDVLALPCFYFHLMEACSADRNRVYRVRNLLASIRCQSLNLQEDLKYCSPLGSFLRSMRNVYPNSSRPIVGLGTIRRLEEAGIRNAAELSRHDAESLVQLGIRRDLAHQIHAYVRRRVQ